MATATLYSPAGFNRADQPLALDRDLIDEVDFDADECLFFEALEDAGYTELGRANWIHYGGNEWRVYDGRRVAYIAEVVQ